MHDGHSFHQTFCQDSASQIWKSPLILWSPPKEFTYQGLTNENISGIILEVWQIYHLVLCICMLEKNVFFNALLHMRWKSLFILYNKYKISKWSTCILKILGETFLKARILTEMIPKYTYSIAVLLYPNSLFALVLMHKKEKEAWKRNIHLVYDKQNQDRTKSALFKKWDSWLCRTWRLASKCKRWFQAHIYSIKTNIWKRRRELWRCLPPSRQSQGSWLWR